MLQAFAVVALAVPLVDTEPPLLHEEQISHLRQLETKDQKIAELTAELAAMRKRLSTLKHDGSEQASSRESMGSALDLNSKSECIIDDFVSLEEWARPLSDT